jgi:hypothetical protein
MACWFACTPIVNKKWEVTHDEHQISSSQVGLWPVTDKSIEIVQYIQILLPWVPEFVISQTPQKLWNSQMIAWFSVILYHFDWSCCSDTYTTDLMSLVPEAEDNTITYRDSWDNIFCEWDEDDLTEESITDSDSDYDTMLPQWDSDGKKVDISPAIEVQRTQLL